MNEITQILQAAEHGDAEAARKLLPLVYDELRCLASHKLAHEAPGQTLDATALVHEAYLRLVGNGPEQSWENRGHYFAAAAEAMRRILVENARRKRSQKRGGDHSRRELDPSQIASPGLPENLIALDAALDKLAQVDPQVVELVKLRYFAGLKIKQAAAILNISPRTADSYWAYARAWLKAELDKEK